MVLSTKGGGSFFNDKPTQVLNKSKLIDCVIGTGFPYNKKDSPGNNLDYFSKIVPQLRGVRRIGSAAYDISLVAAGIFDGFWEMNLNLWDIAAASLFVTEAGGVVHSFRDDYNLSIVCGNGIIVDQLSQYLI